MNQFGTYPDSLVEHVPDAGANILRVRVCQPDKYFEKI